MGNCNRAPARQLGRLPITEKSIRYGNPITLPAWREWLDRTNYPIADYPTSKVPISWQSVIGVKNLEPASLPPEPLLTNTLVARDRFVDDRMLECTHR